MAVFVKKQALPKEFGRIELVTSRLGTGKSVTFFNSVLTTCAYTYSTSQQENFFAYIYPLALNGTPHTLQ